MIIALLKKIHYKSKENKFWLFGVRSRKCTIRIKCNGTCYDLLYF